MVIFLWILFGLFCYLVTGNLLGRLTLHEFFDDTPTEQASFGKQILRNLLFIDAWKDRYHDHDYDGQTETFLCKAGLDSRETNRRTPERKETYIRIITLLWPSKIVPFVCGVFYMLGQLAIYIADILARVINIFLVLIHRFAGQQLRLPYRLKKRYVSPEAMDINQRVEALVYFKDTEIGKQIDRLTELRTTAGKTRTQIVESMDRWSKLIPELEKRGSPTARYTQLVQTLHEKLKQKRTEIEAINSALKIIQENKKELDFLLDILREHRSTIQLIGKEYEDAFQEALNSALATMNVCQEAIERAGTVEDEFLTRLDAPLDSFVERREATDIEVARVEARANQIATTAQII